MKPTRLFCRSRLRKFATNHYQIATKNVLTIIVRQPNMVRTQTMESSVIHFYYHYRLRSMTRNWWKNEHPSELPYSEYDTHNSHETSTVDATFLDTMREQCMQYATTDSVQLQNPDLMMVGICWRWCWCLFKCAQGCSDTHNPQQPSNNN